MANIAKDCGYMNPNVDTFASGSYTVSERYMHLVSKMNYDLRPLMPEASEVTMHPEKMPIDQLIDPKRLADAAETAAQLVGMSVSLSACKYSSPTPAAPDVPMLFFPDGMENDDEAHIKSHFESVVSVEKLVSPVRKESGGFIYYSVPIVLRFQEYKYPKAIITLAIPKDTSQADEKLYRFIDQIAQSLSSEITLKYELLRTTVQNDIEKSELAGEIERLEKFLGHVGGGLLLIDRNFRIIWTNETTVQSFQIDKPIVGLRCYEIFHNRTERCENCAVKRAFDTGEQNVVCSGSVLANGEYKYYQKTATPIIDSSGKADRAVVLIHDITDLWQMEQELEKRTQMLEIQNRKVVEASKQKNQLFTGISHDLRTPLTSIIGFTEILQEETENILLPRQKDMLMRVSQNADRLLKMINDLMDLAKLESGTMKIRPSRVRLPIVVDHVINTMLPLVKGKNIKLSAEFAENLPQIYTDEQKLTQILINLVSNAIKFTPEGSVTVRVQPNGNKIIMEVSDTGIGIHENDFGKIFEEFSQIERKKTPNGGTGLGLAITNRLTKLLGGEIEVSSKLKQGSTFTVKLPLSIQT